MECFSELLLMDVMTGGWGTSFFNFSYALIILAFCFPEGTHIKLVFTTKPLPVQNMGNSLRHSATARLVRRVQGTR